MTNLMWMSAKSHKNSLGSRKNVPGNRPLQIEAVYDNVLFEEEAWAQFTEGDNLLSEAE